MTLRRALCPNGETVTIDVNDLPPFAYELVEVERYVRRGPGPVRHANAIFSRGCPYHCDFCLDSRKKWFGLSLPRMEAELRFWVLQHGVNSLRFYDGNFFGLLGNKTEQPPIQAQDPVITAWCGASDPSCVQPNGSPWGPPGSRMFTISLGTVQSTQHWYWDWKMQPS